MPFFFSFLFFLIALIFLIIATFTDLKERIVSNKLNYSMIALGIALHAVQAVVESNALIFYFTIACVIATFIAAYLLWKLGVWAGGDVKLFTAIAALLPLNPAFFPQLLGYANGVFAPLQIPVFPLTLFVFSVFAMFPLGFAIGIKGILKSKKLKARLSKELKEICIFTFFYSLAIAGLEQLFRLAGISVFLIIIPLIALALLPKKLQCLVSILLFITAFVLVRDYGILREFFWVFISLLAISVFLKLFFTSKNEVLIIERKILQLKEGDIVAESIVAVKGRAERFKGLGLRETFKYLKSHNLAGLLNALQPKGRIVADRHSAAGVTLEELKELKALVKKKMLSNRILVKLSVPFVPGVLVAFVFLAFASDVLWRVLFP